MGKATARYQETSPPPAGEGTPDQSALRIGIVSWSGGAFGLGQLQRLRTEMRLPEGQPLPHAFVRHADEQTLAGLAAVLQTWRQLPQPLPLAEQWGVLAAPEYFGKEATLAALQRYRAEGPSAISPHLIPNHCLHSLAGSISVLLGLHGPNYGVGGGPGQFAELLLAGILETVQQPVPGFWLVATAWRMVPSELGLSAQSVPVCLALALAVCRVPQAELHSLPSRRCDALAQAGSTPPHDSSNLPVRAALAWKSWPRIVAGASPASSERFTSFGPGASPLQLESFLRALHTPVTTRIVPNDTDLPTVATAASAGGNAVSGRQGRPAASARVFRWICPEIGVLELRKSQPAQQTLSASTEALRPPLFAGQEEAA